MKKTPNVQELQNEVSKLKEIIKRLEQKDIISDQILPLTKENLVASSLN